MCDGFYFLYAGLERRLKDESKYQMQSLISCVLVRTIVGKQTRRTNSEPRDATIVIVLYFLEL